MSKKTFPLFVENVIPFSSFIPLVSFCVKRLAPDGQHSVSKLTTARRSIEVGQIQTCMPFGACQNTAVLSAHVRLQQRQFIHPKSIIDIVDSSKINKMLSLRSVKLNS